MSAERGESSAEYQQMQRAFFVNSDAARLEADEYWQYFLDTHPDDSRLKVPVVGAAEEPELRPLTILEALENFSEITYGGNMKTIASFAEVAIERAVKSARDSAVQSYDKWLRENRAEVDSDFGSGIPRLHTPELTQPSEEKIQEAA